jgi:multidrug transporter EmrE-like cation transporter
MIGYLFLLGAFLANGTANILLKLGADKGIRLDWSLGILGLITHHAFLILGTTLFAVNLVLYIAALRAFPLSFAYPVMVGMSFIVATSAAIFFLGEQPSPVRLAGCLLIVVGLTIAVRG